MYQGSVHLPYRRLCWLFIAAFFLALVSVGCSTPKATNPTASERPLTAGKPDPSYLTAVTLSPGDTLQAVEAKHGGQVLVWEAGVYAILGLEKAGAGGLETNDNAFLAGGERATMSGRSRAWAGGRSRAWAGGRSRAWAGGRSRAWAGGAFTWMPENTAAWQQVHLEQGQNLTENLGYGIKVAIIDTGVDLEHPALKEALAPREEWWDFYGDDALPQEEGTLGEGGYGHGTNVAGIVRQVAPRATILPLRVLGPEGDGNLTDVAAAIQWAVSQGAQVINLSLGSDKKSNAIEKVIDSAVSKGVLVVAATGNTGDTAVTYPARSASKGKTAAQRLSVTSVNPNDVKSDFATYSKEVELAAPGEAVFGPAPGERMAAWSGTSMAAPVASGALALALGEKLSVPKAELAESLKASAFDLYDRNEPFVGQLGAGRLDVAAFLSQVMVVVSENAPDEDEGNQDGEDTQDGNDDPAEDGSGDQDNEGDQDDDGETPQGEVDPVSGPCKGGVTNLTLRYTGSASAYVAVEQKDKTVVFASEVEPGQTFSFEGAQSDGTLGKEVKLYVDGKKRDKARTDCSKPIGPGLTLKSFEVMGGESKEGGVLPQVQNRKDKGDDSKDD